MWVQLRQGYSRRGGRGIVVRKCLDVEPCCCRRGLCAPGTGRAPWAGCRRAGVLLDVLSVQKAFRLKRRNAPNAAAVLVLAAALPRPGSGGTQLPMAGTTPPDALPAQQCISIIFCVSHLCKRARGPLNLFQGIPRAGTWRALLSPSNSSQHWDCCGNPSPAAPQIPKAFLPLLTPTSAPNLSAYLFFDHSQHHTLHLSFLFSPGANHLHPILRSIFSSL